MLGPTDQKLEQNRRPLLLEIPASTHVTVPVWPNRRPNPAAYAINADTAPPTVVLAGWGQRTAGSGASRATNLVNRSPIAPADAEKERSHPRTVDAGRPHPTATLRCPHPRTMFFSRASAITAALSARRAANHTSNSTCVARHATHRARRGRHVRPAQSVSRPSRITRSLAHPHGRNRPPHPGQSTRPECRPNSTTTASSLTVSISAPLRVRTARRDPLKIARRAVRLSGRRQHDAADHQTPNPPTLNPIVTEDDAHVVTPRDVQQMQTLPRARGGVPAVEAKRGTMARPSPRTRGCSPIEQWITIQQAPFPAHAGVFPWASNSPQPRRSLPRARGGVPLDPLACGCHRRPSPRTRGCSLLNRRISRSENPFPAHAGVFPGYHPRSI